MSGRTKRIPEQVSAASGVAELRMYELTRFFAIKIRFHPLQ